MASIFKMIVNYKYYLILGTKVTIVVSLLASICGLLCGILMALLKRCHIAPIRWFANVYVEVVRGTPVLVQISMVYYGLPMIGVSFPNIEIGGVTFDRLFAGILALAINSTAYICEIIRGGIESVDSGQKEAAEALGFGQGNIMKLIILPQALRNVLPTLGNEFVSMVKQSSQVSIMGLADLMYAADIIRGNTYRPFTPLVIVAVIYLILTILVSYIFKWIERFSCKGRKTI